MIRIPARFLGLLLLFITSFIANIAIAYDDKDFPKPSNPPRLVNDFAGMMSAAEQQQLESLLVSYDDSTSVQIAVVTLQSLGSYDISVYAPELFTRWGIGQKGKDNGVLILASASDRKIFISTGRGINAVITDARAGSIIRDIITPNFKQGRYFQGFYDASNAIIQLSKGEYKNDKKRPAQEGEGAIPVIVFLVIMFVIIFIIASGKGGGKGGGGGNYMSRRGSDFLTGAILGSILDRASRGSGGWGGGHGGGGFGGGGFGGFGGFGGGSTDGGGAGGSW